jgi:hypothetical protein
VPGDATRAFWIGLVSAAPLPVVTYVIYSKAAPGSTVSSPAGYAAWVFVWCTFAVLLSSATARVIGRSQHSTKTSSLSIWEKTVFDISPTC